MTRKDVGKTLFASLVAGIMFAAGAVFGADSVKDDMFHVEQFEAITIDGEGFYGEPVDLEGNRITGEGVFLDVDYIPIEANEGDIVTVYWTQNQADNSDWATPAKVTTQKLEGN